MSLIRSPSLETMQRLTALRGLPQLMRLLRQHGARAIGCDGFCLLLVEGGVLRARACDGIDQRQSASLVEQGGPAARAIEEGRVLLLRGADSDYLVVPLAVPGSKVALVARRAGAWTDPLRSAAERFAVAVADALMSVSLVDRLPHLLFTACPDGSVEVFGELWCDYGIGLDEALPHPRRLLRLLHPSERNAVMRHWRNATPGAQVFEIEHRLLHRDGRYRWFRTRAVPVEPLLLCQEQSGRAFIGTSTEIDALVLARTEEQRHRLEIEQRLLAEISDRGRAEARLAKAERIEAVGQLTSGVAHDFNNLLTVIIGNIEFLESSTSGGDALDARARARLAAMREAAERGGNLTRQLLAFARRQRLEPRPIDLNDVVAELRMLLPSATGGGIEVETRLADGVWLALVDRTQIERMILNLAFNAHDAMGVGGAITISTRNRPVGADEVEALGLPGAGDYVEIAVGDTGRGMPPEVLARVFEPFFTTKPPGKGSGLGLAQVYGFARQSGGGVTLHSVQGEGTIVSILLPRASQLAPDQGQHDAAPACDEPPRSFAIPPVPTEPSEGAVGMPSSLHRVLLVDDDAAVREVTSTILGEAGYRVIEAAGGQEALQRLEETGQVDLMVTDYAMPGMSGHELWQAAMELQPELKVLFVTGYADLTALAAVPQRRILLKPFRSALLLEKITGALAG